jgi:hypothetical protein
LPVEDVQKEFVELRNHQVGVQQKVPKDAVDTVKEKERFKFRSRNPIDPKTKPHHKGQLLGKRE